MRRLDAHERSLRPADRHQPPATPSPDRNAGGHATRAAAPLAPSRRVPACQHPAGEEGDASRTTPPKVLPRFGLHQSGGTRQEGRKVSTPSWSLFRRPVHGPGRPSHPVAQSFGGRGWTHMSDEIAELRARHALATERINQLDSNPPSSMEFRGRPDNGESPTTWQSQCVSSGERNFRAPHRSAPRRSRAVPGQRRRAMQQLRAPSAPSNRCSRTGSRSPTNPPNGHRPHHPKRNPASEPTNRRGLRCRAVP